MGSVQFSSVAQSCPTLRTHGLQHARPPFPSPTSRVYPHSCPLSWWYHPAISSSVVPFSSGFKSFPLQIFPTPVGSHSLLQGIFLTQRLNPDLLHCRQILYHLSHQGSPKVYLSSISFANIFSQSIGCLFEKKKKKKPFLLKSKGFRTSLVVQWLRICLPMQGIQVWSLVKELESHIPWGN